MSEDILNLNYNTIIDEITRFIKEQVRSRKKNGLVMGLSGGLDSSVCLVLASKAIQRNRIMVLIMPERGLTPKKDIYNARDLAKEMKINYKEIHFERAKRILLNTKGQTNCWKSFCKTKDGISIPLRSYQQSSSFRNLGQE
jgi:NAD+ synthetase